jgi:uncharacterized protein (DUF2062 family)
MEITSHTINSRLPVQNGVSPIVEPSAAEGEIIIEEISRNHKLLYRHRLSQNHINIGRDYQNDLILTDPHICPQHLSLTFSDGNWYISDKSSVNGTRIEGTKGKSKNPHQQIVNDGDIVVLGKSQLRIVFSTHKVATTIAFSPFDSVIDFFRHPLAVFIAVSLFMLISGNIAYLNQQTETNVSQIFVNAFTMTLLFALWPCGVALVSHLTKQDPRILAQLGISFSFFALLWLSDFAEHIIAFNSASNSLLSILITLVPIALAFCLFWLNSYIGFQVSAKRRIFVALSITILLFGGSYLLQFSKKPEFNPRPSYDSIIMTPGFLLSPSSNVDDFVKQSNTLFEQVDKAVQDK